MAPRLLPPCLPALLVACGGESPTAVPAETPPPVLQHDFGVVRHGETPSHDFVIDPHPLGDRLIPLGVRLDCSCARSEMLLRDAEGNERPASGRPFAAFAARPDEKIVARVHLLTERKEAVDHPPAVSPGYVILQPAAATSPSDRVHVGIELRYAIDSPVRIRPFAHLDFGEVPMSSPYSLEVALEGDVPERRVRFGPATCAADEIEPALREDDDGGTVLRVRFEPVEQGPFKHDVWVATDLPDGYRVRIPVSGVVVPDIVVTPMGKISFGGIDFAEKRESFALVTDHDKSRSPEFSVARIVDHAGADVSRHFEVQLLPEEIDPRTTRVILRYLGTLDPAVLEASTFRGELVLAKDPVEGPFVPIEVVAFQRVK